jgi:hypothetical protein
MHSSSHRSIAKLVALALALSAGLILAVACGGGSSKPDATKIYKDLGTKMAAVTAFHIDANTVGGTQAGPFKGDFVAPDKFQFSATFTDETGQTVEYGQLQTGTTFYVKNSFGATPSSDWYVYDEALFGQSGDAVGFVNGLWTKLSALTLVGEEDMGGVAMYHVQATISPDLLGLVETDPKPTKDNTIDLWVGKKDSLVHRLKYTFTEAGATTTIDLSQFNDKTISVETPSNPLPAAELYKQYITTAPQETQDCLRTAWGDAAFGALAAGTRVPTADEHSKGDQCFGGGGGATPAAPAANTPPSNR